MMQLFRLSIIPGLNLLLFIFWGAIQIGDKHAKIIHTGTSIVIIAKNDQIAAAADSKILLDQSKLLSSDCKIKQFEGNNFFALAGFRRESTTNFDAIYIALEAGRMTSNAADKVSKFEALITPTLYNMLRSIQHNDKVYFEKSMHKKKILQAAFFGYENELPYLYTRTFTCNSTSEGKIKIEIDRQECVAQCDLITILGKSSAIEKYIESNPNYRKIIPIELVRKFVELEILDDPETVGPPIDVLLVTKRGSVWRERKPECKDELNGKYR